METLMWAIDLILVAGFCFWAIREDSSPKQDKMSDKKDIAAKSSGKQTRISDHA